MRLSLNLASARRFRTAHRTPARRAFIAALLVFCLRDDGRTSDALSRSMNGDTGQICGPAVPALFGAIVLHPTLHPNLHRSMEDAINRRAQDHKIADPN